MNDCVNLAAALRDRAPGAEIHTLTDKKATAAHIRQALAELTVSQASTRIFQMSSHGTFLPDLNHDEVVNHNLSFTETSPGTTYDQCLVPIDYESSGMIIDDELGAFSDLVPESGRLIYWLDACYSGGSSRAGGELFNWSKRKLKLPTSRSLPAHRVTQKVIERTREAPTIIRPIGNRLRAGRLSKDFISFNDERSILIASAQSDQPAADAFISNKWQGAGTCALLDAWRALGPQSSYIAVVRRANVWLQTKGYAQRIQLEGAERNISRPFLS